MAECASKSSDSSSSASSSTTESYTEDDLTSFLLFANSALHWNELEGKVVMDVGCGDGRTSTNLLIGLFPKIFEVIAIDLAKDNIERAQRDGNDRISYYPASIADWFTLSAWENHISAMISIDCLNWLHDPRLAYINIYKLLKPGGSAAFLMNIDAPYQECIEYMFTNTAWRYSELAAPRIFPRFPARCSTKEEHKQLLEEVGLKVVYMEEYKRVFVFESEDYYITKGWEFLMPFMAELPVAMRRHFMEDFFKTFNELNGTSITGKSCIKRNTLNILIIKPESIGCF